MQVEWIVLFLQIMVDNAIKEKEFNARFEEPPSIIHTVDEYEYLYSEL